jgi:hypothetical protein
LDPPTSSAPPLAFTSLVVIVAVVAAWQARDLYLGGLDAFVLWFATDWLGWKL